MAEKRRAWDREYRRRKRQCPPDIHPTSTRHLGYIYSKKESKIEDKISKEESKYIPPKSASTRHPPDIYLDQFPEFWALYPRKEAKKNAAKAFAKLIRDGTDPETVINGLRKFRFSDDPAFIPHPATWLNGRRWEDQPAQVIKITAKPLTYRQEQLKKREELLDRLKRFANSSDEADGAQGGFQLGPPDYPVISSR